MKLRRRGERGTSWRRVVRRLVLLRFWFVVIRVWRRAVIVVELGVELQVGDEDEDEDEDGEGIVDVNEETSLVHKGSTTRDSFEG